MYVVCTYTVFPVFKMNHLIIIKIIVIIFIGITIIFLHQVEQLRLIFENAKKKDDGFNYHIFFASNNKATGFAFQTGRQRFTALHYGTAISLDAKKGGTNTANWPYKAITVVDQENKVHCVVHSCFVGELLEAYEELLRKFLEWCPELRGKVITVNSDQFITEETLMKVLPGLKLARLDDYHMQENFKKTCIKMTGFDEAMTEYLKINKCTDLGLVDALYNDFMAKYRGTLAGAYVERVWGFKHRWVHAYTHRYFNAGKDGSSISESHNSVIAAYLVQVESLPGLVMRLLCLEDHKKTGEEAFLNNLNLERQDFINPCDHHNKTPVHQCASEMSTYATTRFKEAFADCVNYMVVDEKGVALPSRSLLVEASTGRKYVYVWRQGQRLENKRKVYYLHDGNGMGPPWYCSKNDGTVWGQMCEHTCCIDLWWGGSGYQRNHFLSHWHLRTRVGWTCRAIPEEVSTHDGGEDGPGFEPADQDDGCEELVDDEAQWAEQQQLNDQNEQQPKQQLKAKSNQHKRFQQLMELFKQVASEASPSEEMSQLLLNELLKWKSRIMMHGEEVDSLFGGAELPSKLCKDGAQLQQRVRDCVGGGMKRKRSAIEKIMTKKKSNKQQKMCSFCNCPGHKANMCKARHNLGQVVKLEDLDVISELKLRPVHVPPIDLAASAINSRDVQHVQMHGVLDVQGQGIYVDLSFVNYNLVVTKATKYFKFDALLEWFAAKDKAQTLLRTKQLCKLPVDLTVRVRLG
jgi:hypothetical protein